MAATWCCVHLQAVEDWLENNHYEKLAEWLADRASFARCIYYTPNLSPQQLLDQLTPEQRASLQANDHGYTNYAGPTIVCEQDMLEIGFSPKRDWINS